MNKNRKNNVLKRIQSLILEKKKNRVYNDVCFKNGLKYFRIIVRMQQEKKKRRIRRHRENAKTTGQRNC